jgi:small-conductance mechanosensitive channel
MTIVIATIVALRIAGLQSGTLAVGGGFTAVVVGLAAQQVLGNMLAGLVLITNRPFRVGERVGLQGSSAPSPRSRNLNGSSSGPVSAPRPARARCST